MTNSVVGQITTFCNNWILVYTFRVLYLLPLIETVQVGCMIKLKDHRMQF